MISEEEANRQQPERVQEHPEVEAKERLEEQEAQQDVRLRSCIPYDIQLRGLLYDIMIEIEIDLEECSKDPGKWKGRIETQKKNLDISKQILEKCKLKRRNLFNR